MEFESNLQISINFFSTASLSEQHDGGVRGRDVVVRTGSNVLVSSYVNVDREPIFYKKTSTTWVANELIYGR